MIGSSRSVFCWYCAEWDAAEVIAPRPVTLRAMELLGGDGYLWSLRMFEPLIKRTIGTSVYDDTRRMEDTVRDSRLAWTIVRPSILLDLVRHRRDDGVELAGTVQGDGCDAMPRVVQQCLELWWLRRHSRSFAEMAWG
jgi:hypothetical protein